MPSAQDAGPLGRSCTVSDPDRTGLSPASAFSKLKPGKKPHCLRPQLHHLQSGDRWFGILRSENSIFADELNIQVQISHTYFVPWIQPWRSIGRHDTQKNELGRGVSYLKVEAETGVICLGPKNRKGFAATNEWGTCNKVSSSRASRSSTALP